MRYDPLIDMQNRVLGAFTNYAANCAACGERVFLSQASKDLLNGGQDFKILCQICAVPLIQKESSPQFTISPGHIEELHRYFERQRAKNN